MTELPQDTPVQFKKPPPGIIIDRDGNRVAYVVDGVRVPITEPTMPEEKEKNRNKIQWAQLQAQYEHMTANNARKAGALLASKFVQNPRQVKGRVSYGMNEPCPCGSGKKYKKCHLSFA